VAGATVQHFIATKDSPIFILWRPKVGNMFSCVSVFLNSCLFAPQLVSGYGHVLILDLGLWHATATYTHTSFPLQLATPRKQYPEPNTHHPWSHNAPFLVVVTLVLFLDCVLLSVVADWL